jgi:hypothetical protein
MAQQQIFRVSVVRIYSAKPTHRKQNQTPEPFCELRAFVFLPKKPSIYELKLLNNGLTQVVNYTENLFQSIQVAMDMDSIESDEKLFEEGVRVQPATPQSFLQIDGYEISELDKDEAEKYFRDSQKIHFFNIQRYVAFYDQYGVPSKEYDSSNINDIERVTKLQQAQKQIP